jgi:hypothetical protein
VDDESIRTLIERLARPRVAGGEVVERAAILAEGADFTEVMAWIVARGGRPEEIACADPSGGLYGARLHHAGVAKPTPPLRFILPPGALAQPAAAVAG